MFKEWASRFKKEMLWGKKLFKTVRYSTKKHEIILKLNDEFYHGEFNDLFVFNYLKSETMNQWVLFGPQIKTIKSWKHKPTYSEVLKRMKEYKGLTV